MLMEKTKKNETLKKLAKKLLKELYGMEVK
jgi:hypothetical protein